MNIYFETFCVQTIELQVAFLIRAWKVPCSDRLSWLRPLVVLCQGTYRCNISNYVMTTTATPQAGRLINPLYNPGNVQTDSDFHSASFSTGNRGALPEGKAASALSWSLLPLAELKDSSSTPYTNMACTGTIFCFHNLSPPSISWLFINLPVVWRYTTESVVK
jgi:hypothetical protein